MQPEIRSCQNCKRSFIIEPEDFEFYAKIQVPPPTWCPQCRMVRRMVWRTKTELHRRKDSRTGKMIFSAFPEEVPFPVWELDDWNSDLFEGTEYGREYDWNKTFFEQFRELMNIVPQPSRNVQGLVRSDYVDNASYIEDCYLMFAAITDRNCAYGFSVLNSNDSFDIDYASHLDLCYEDTFCKNSYRTFYSFNCQNARNSYFCKDSVEINDCFGCIGLRKKSHCIFNQQYSKEEYSEIIKGFNLGSHKAVEEMRKKVWDFFRTFPVRFSTSMRAEDSSGDYLFNTKNVRQSFLVTEGENVKYCQHMAVPTSKDCYDYNNWGNNAELVYECSGVGDGVSRIKFSHQCFPACKDLDYAVSCRNSSDLFGCVGLKKKQYCILNKQYSKEDYEAMLPKIKQHMTDMPYTDEQGRVYTYGEYFPPSFAPHGYNMSSAFHYFPLSESAAKGQGYSWEAPAARTYTVTQTAAELPDHITNIEDSITKEVLACEHKESCAENCSGAYRMLDKELEFLRMIGAPVPRLCPNCRFARRAKDFSRPVFYQRSCQCAGKKSSSGVYQNVLPHKHGTTACPTIFQTSYTPDMPEIIYCESCYQQEVV